MRNSALNVENRIMIPLKLQCSNIYDVIRGDNVKWINICILMGTDVIRDDSVNGTRIHYAVQCNSTEAAKFLKDRVDGITSPHGGLHDYIMQSYPATMRWR